jgi:hypothetical protein
MAEDSSVHNKAAFKRNVPIATNQNVPLSELGHSTCCRKSIHKKNIEELAIEKYRTTGEGIVFTDITRAFPCSKNKAQRILKDCCNKAISKTGYKSRPLLFRSFKRTSPQQYFPSCIRADIVEDLKKREIVLKDPTEVAYSSKSPISTTLVNLHTQQKSQHILDVLTSLPFAPLCIHKLQLQLDIVREGYDDTKLDSQRKNKAKVHEERIGQVKGRPNVKYYLYPSGKVMVYVECSENPFKLVTDTDVSLLFAFFGQVRDRLLYLLSDVRERMVPSIMEWRLIQCDVNRDVEIDDNMQLTLPDIQLKYANRVFRLYVKSLHDKAVCRGEESLKLNLLLPEAFDSIRNPYKSLDKKLDEILQHIIIISSNTGMRYIAHPK